MKTMVLIDLITARKSLLSLIGLGVILGVFLTFTTESLVGGIAAMTVIIPFMFLFSICAYDEMGGWERFRLTLPITRRQVAFGRYGSLFVTLVAAVMLAFVMAHIMVAIGDAIPGTPEYITSQESGFWVVCATVLAVAAIVLLVAAVALPFIMRFGMTTATRILPVAIVMILALGVAAAGDAGTAAILSAISEWALGFGSDALKLFAVAAIAVVFVLYVRSAFLSAKLYEQREL